MLHRLPLVLLLLMAALLLPAQERRPIDARHPLWLVHIDVWNKADPQKIIDLIPEDVKPYVCMNLSLSCQYDTARRVYKMPQNAIRTYKSWATVCQANRLWFTCQPASGGHTHIQDNDLETFEYFYRRYPNFLGWNYAEQFWGFDEPGDKSSSPQATRLALFARLVEMAHRYGGFLTVSFCGNIWSHPLNPMGMMKRNADLLAACKAYPEAILWLYKYTTSSCFYNNESVTIGPFIAGLAANYGVRYDNCGWNGSLDEVLGRGHGCTYPVAAGIGTVMEQTGINGGAVWDGPELIWTEDFQNLRNSTVKGFTHRNWGTFPGFRNAWIDLFRKVIDGTLTIPTRADVVGRTKIAVVNDLATGSDEDKYAAWGSLYDGLYKQDDPMNRGRGQWMENGFYLKRTGRYGVIPVVPGLYDDLARAIPVQVSKSAAASRWPSEASKVAEFDANYAETSRGDLFVSRFRNQLVTYTPYSYLNGKTTATAVIPLQYNSCASLQLTYGKLGSGVIKEYAGHIDVYLNNYRSDSAALVTDRIVVTGVTAEPSCTVNVRAEAQAETALGWDAAQGTYTVEVRHNGPVDLRIVCRGEADGRRTDVLDSTRLSLDLPRQPAPQTGELVVEAEDMDWQQIKSCVLDPYNAYPQVRGHAGNGFMDMGTSPRGCLRHTVRTERGGDYAVGVRYQSPDGDARLTVSVNGVGQTLDCPRTAAGAWGRATLTAAFTAGENRLLLNNVDGRAMYIDQVTCTPAGTPAETFAVTLRPSAHGTATASTATAAEGQTVTLQAEPAAGYELAGWELVHGDVTIDGQSFVMPDDNVTLIPLFRDTTAVYRLDFSATAAGALPEGWQTDQGGELHEYPNIYGSGARTMVGFTGWQGKALYWRVGSAAYGRQPAHRLALAPGRYELTLAVAAWKGVPHYRVAVESLAGQQLFLSPDCTAAPNADGNRTADISGAQPVVLPFTVKAAGNYVVKLVSEGGFSEYLLADCRVNKVVATGLESVDVPAGAAAVTGIYNVAGVRLERMQRGLNILRTADGTARKVFVGSSASLSRPRTW